MDDVTDDEILTGFESPQAAMELGFERVSLGITGTERSLRGDTALLELRVLRRFDAVDERLDLRVTRLEARLDTIERRLDLLTARVGKMDFQLSKIDARLDKIAHLAKVDVRLAGMGERADG